MKTTLLFSILFLPLFLNAQLTTDDFESYSEGAFDSQWDPAEWVGWFGATSNAFISTDLANSGTNSLHVRSNVTDTDVVGLFGILNSGIYEISFMQYIPGTNGAYYNLQHNYTNTAGDWAAEFYFANATTPQGQIITNNVQYIFTAIHDQWVENRFVFNFLADEAEFYYNGVLTHTWQISTNSAGGAGLNQINAINLYAACLGTGCVSQAYYDDILVEEIPLPEFDIALTDALYPTEYTMVPDGYVQPFAFGADVSNAGVQTVNNVEVTAYVYDGTNTLIHTESLGSVGSLASGATDNFFAVSTFTPTASDNYTVEYIATLDEVDVNPGDNEFTGIVGFEVTDTVYARDDGNYTDGIGVNGAPGILGQSFEFIDAAAIKSISMSYAGTGIGDTIVGYIYTAGGTGAPDVLIASSKAFVIETAGSLGGEVFVDLDFPSSVQLIAGNYVFLVEQKGLTNLLVSTSTNIFTPGATWASLDNGATWANLETFGFSIVLNIRPILDLTVSTEEPAFVESFTLSPNPNNGKANIQLELTTQKDLVLDIFNLQGQLVHSIKDYNVAGSMQYPLDLTNLADGIYIVKLTIDNQITSRQLNLTK